MGGFSSKQNKTYFSTLLMEGSILVRMLIVWLARQVASKLKMKLTSKVHPL